MHRNIEVYAVSKLCGHHLADLMDAAIEYQILPPKKTVSGDQGINAFTRFEVVKEEQKKHLRFRRKMGVKLLIEKMKCLRFVQASTTFP